MIDATTAAVLRDIAVGTGVQARRTDELARLPGMTKKDAAKLVTIASRLRDAANGARYLASTAKVEP